MLHGASSNLEVMRQPVGERLARSHRVILIDRPGHGWSTRVRLEDSTPEIQARMIEEALASSASTVRFCGAFLGRRAGGAHRAGLPASASPAW
jgi:pimeloyl-ACP methyl ester carboxylesterase